MQRLITALIITTGILAITAAVRADDRVTFDELLDAIRTVESGGRKNPPDGDGGRSIGPYQIMRAYHADSRVACDYENCRDEAYARSVVTAYLRRYEPGAVAVVDWQKLAALHNAGPGWRKKPAAVQENIRAYQKKIRAAITAAKRAAKQ